ncbi:hypothetical protein ACFFX0_31045 [Citricoccus parietis]|uniref:Uncharacterized protein n=1 Tax=Citricoccus parietis TaxID=592307 RepID=A0ABV5G8U6_9MICC
MSEADPNVQLGPAPSLAPAPTHLRHNIDRSTPNTRRASTLTVRLMRSDARRFRRHQPERRAG